MLHIKKNKLKRNKKIYFWFGITLLASLGLAIAGEFNAMMAWWIVIALLLPPLLCSLKTPYVSLKTICGISFVTQISTLPFFYLYSDNFAWGHVKPFNFTALESFTILVKVSLFLYALVLIFKWLYPITLIGGSIKKITKSYPPNKENQYTHKRYSGLNVSRNERSWLFSLLIILLISALTPINMWSYSKGIGLTGVEPPVLPYRLSGILFYLTKYITPALIGYFYLHTKRGWPLMILILAYACMLGLSSVSKGAVLFVMFPVLVFAWLDKRKIMFGIIFAGTVIGIAAASGARAYTYILIDGKISADASLSIIKLISNVYSDLNNELWNFDFFPKMIVGILGRIEAFENLVMAQYYNPNAVIGEWGFILRMIGIGLADFDTNAHMIQWQGNLLPEGFFNGGALLSNAVILGNAGFLWIILSAMITAVFLVIIEKSSCRIKIKYQMYKLINAPIIFSLSVIFFTSTGATAITFTYPFLFLFFFSWLPPIVLKKQEETIGARPLS